jgi:hypothetical protein
VTRPRRRISAFILAILLLHAVPVARELSGAPETLWPFLTWGMYRHFERLAERLRSGRAIPAGHPA